MHRGERRGHIASHLMEYDFEEVSKAINFCIEHCICVYVVSQQTHTYITRVL